MLYGAPYAKALPGDQLSAPISADCCGNGNRRDLGQDQRYLIRRAAMEHSDAPTRPLAGTETESTGTSTRERVVVRTPSVL